MSISTKPILHNGNLNSTINVSDMENSSLTSNLTIAQGDSRYVQSSGSNIISASTIFNNSVSLPSITLNSNSNSQTSGQIGYYSTFNSAISGGSIQNGSLSTPTFNTISLPAGVYMINYYYNITCTASVTFSQIISGISTSTSSFNSQSMTTSSYVSETLASGNKYISGTYFVRPSSTTNYYGQLLITYSTSGTMSSNLGISAIRIA